MTARAGFMRAARGEDTQPMETLVEAIARLRSDGYVTELFASAEGNLVCRTCGTSHDPEAIEIRETVRFEGDSNPDDEAILLAVVSAGGCLGQFSAAFGPGASAADTMALQRLTPIGTFSGSASKGASKVHTRPADATANCVSGRTDG